MLQFLNKTPKIDEKVSYYLYFCVFFFLLYISAFGSLFNSLYYLLHVHRESSITLIFIFIFTLSCFIQAIWPQFGVSLVSIFLGNLSEKYFMYLNNFINNLLKKYPSPLYFFCLFYGCFYFLHVFMLNFIGIEPMFEYLYQLLNLVRLWFFPFVIYTYLVTQAPSSTLLPVLEGITPDNLVKVVQTFQKGASMLAEGAGKNPFATKVVVGVTIIGGGLVGLGNVHKDQISGLTTVPGAKITDYHPLAVKASPKLQEIIPVLTECHMAKVENPLWLGGQTVWSLATGQATITDRFKTAIAEGAKEHLKQLATLQERDLVPAVPPNNFSPSFAASGVQLPDQNASTINNIPQTISQGTQTSESVRVSSPFEDCSGFFDFFPFF